MSRPIRVKPERAVPTMILPTGGYPHFTFNLPGDEQMLDAMQTALRVALRGKKARSAEFERLLQDRIQWATWRTLSDSGISLPNTMCSESSQDCSLARP